MPQLQLHGCPKLLLNSILLFHFFNVRLVVFHRLKLLNHQIYQIESKVTASNNYCATKCHYIPKPIVPKGIPERISYRHQLHRSNQHTKCNKERIAAGIVEEEEEKLIVFVTNAVVYPRTKSFHLKIVVVIIQKLVLTL